MIGDETMTNQSMHKLTENVYYLDSYETTDRPILGAIVGKDRVMAVDGGNSTEHIKLFNSELKKLNIKHPDHMVITHWHWDHIFGIYEMDVPTFAHAKTVKEIKRNREYGWSDEEMDKRVEEGIEIEFCTSRIKLEFPNNRHEIKIKVPEIAFTNRIEIDLGGIDCIIEHVGGDHSEDSCIIFVPQDRVMFLGDCLYADLYTGELSWTSEKLFPLLDHILKYDVDYYLEAHADKPTTRKEMESYARELRYIGKLIDEIGDNKELVIQKLYGQRYISYNEEMEYIVDAFIVGNRKKKM